MYKNNIINNIKRNELFSNIQVEELEALICTIKCFIKEYKKGEVIANEDDKCTTLALILEGKAEIQRLYSNGKYIVLNRFSEGDVFGEALVFSKEQLYPATVVSVTDSKILFIKREDVLELCTSNNKILENFISLLSDKVFILNSKIKSISFKSVKQKVINFILNEAKNQKNNYIVLNYTREEIAAALAIPRPSLSRELMNLRDEGFIDFKGKNITILNIKALEEELFN